MSEEFLDASNPFNEEMCLDWLDSFFDDPDSRVHRVAHEMILIDIDTYGIDEWVDLPVSLIIDNFKEAVEEYSESMHDEFTAILEQEKMLDGMEIHQSYKLDPANTLKKYSSAVVEIFDVINKYLFAQSALALLKVS